LWLKPDELSRSLCQITGGTTPANNSNSTPANNGNTTPLIYGGYAPPSRNSDTLFTKKIEPDKVVRI
jgi:hypothetical protein